VDGLLVVLVDQLMEPWVKVVELVDHMLVVPMVYLDLLVLRVLLVFKVLAVAAVVLEVVVLLTLVGVEVVQV
tara:strand:- start:590 stop:805 length:216 start_codon:yes stop_codon:yes gene_type:complete